MLCKRIALFGCGLIWMAAPLLAQSSPDAFRQNRRTFEALEETVVTVDWFEKRLADALVELHKETGITFLLDESSTDTGLDSETLITRKLESLRLATVLEMFLHEFQCTWKIQDGVIVILSEDAALDIANMGQMVFDCSDIIAKIKPLKRSRSYYGGGSGMGGSRNPAGGPGGVFRIVDQQGFGGSAPVTVQEEQLEIETDSESGSTSQTDSKSTPQTKQPRIDEYTISGRTQLMDTIQETVDPDSWEENGGNARMRPLNDIIVIRNTQANLRGIDQLLKQLRAAGLGN